MARLRILAVMAACLSISGSAFAQPGEWSLAQNTPDPFCNNEGGEGTSILLTVPAPAHISLEIWDEGMTSILRTLVDGLLNAGLHLVFWDGLDSQGIRLPEGPYPYRMTATDPGGQEILFQDTKTAHVDCDTPFLNNTWGTVKAIYR